MPKAAALAANARKIVGERMVPHGAGH